MASKKGDQKRGGVQSMMDILSRYEFEADKQRRISNEFQDYAYRLALELDDLKHKAIYMRLAKKEERGLLERARSFVKGATEAKNKGALFMWKLKQLREERKGV